MPTAHVNGINLYYEIHGDGEPLLFIHGLGSSTRDWEHQVPEFSKAYKVVTFDLRGHGRSEKPRGPYSMAMLAKDAKDLLEELGAKKAHVVGWSLGGCVAFQLAVDVPAMFETLTIVNSAPEFILYTFKQRVGIWQRFAIVRFMGMRKMGEVLAGRLFIKPEHGAQRETFVARWEENDKRAYLAALRAMIGWSVTPRLADIRCPTLIIAADQDYTSVSFKQAYTARIPGARLVTIPDSRHATPIEHPQRFNKALREFLSERC